MTKKEYEQIASALEDMRYQIERSLDKYIEDIKKLIED